MPGFSDLPDSAFEAVVDLGLGLGRVRLDQVDRVGRAADEVLDDVVVGVEELLLHHQQRRDELAVRPQRRLVDEDLAAALGDEPGRVGLGYPGAVDRAGLECGQRRRSCPRGTIVTSPPSLVSCSPLLFNQVRSATSCVLPSCGVAIFLPFRSAALVDASASPRGRRRPTRRRRRCGSRRSSSGRR